MSAPDELLPCPFCGGQPIRSMSAPYIVGCVSKRCPAYANVTGDSMSNATANWNRRYIRAPESAPNALADSILCLEAMNADNLAGYDYGVNEGMVAIEQTLDEVEAGKSLSGISQSRWQKIRERLYALRNQPGGAVPREPTEAPNGLADELERLTKACHDANAEDYPSGCCAWTFRAHDLARYFIDNATAILAALRTKAGEGET